MLPLVCWKAKVENFKIAEIRNVIPYCPLKAKIDWDPLGDFVVCAHWSFSDNLSGVLAFSGLITILSK